MKRFTATDPPFWIALHNPSFDKMRWVSIKKSGEYYEKGVTSIFHEILSTYDLTKEQPIAPLVIDIGMNIGWFSLYSRAHGHHVAAFEPNPVMFLRMCEWISGLDTDIVFFPQTYEAKGVMNWNCKYCDKKKSDHSGSSNYCDVRIFSCFVLQSEVKHS